MYRIPRSPERPAFPPAPRPAAVRPAAPLRAVPDGPGETTPITAIEDGLEHEVAAEELRAGSVFGRYRALCGAVIGPVALTVPAGVACRCCAVEVDPAPESRVSDARRSRRATAAWLRGLRARTARRDASPAGAGEGGDVAA